jgi:hypothetical protein
MNAQAMGRNPRECRRRRIKWAATQDSLRSQLDHFAALFATTIPMRVRTKSWRFFQAWLYEGARAGIGPV